MTIAARASLTSFALLLGCASADLATPTVAPVLNGSPSTRDGVVAVVNPAELCSGFLIAPNLVLTARHCVSTLRAGGTNACSTAAGPDGGTLQPTTPASDYMPSEIYVYARAQVPSSGIGGLRVAEVIVLPDSSALPLCGHDVALLRLASPNTAVTPIAPRLDSPPRVGESLVVVGYGRSVGADPDSAGVRLEVTGSSPESVGETLDVRGATRTSASEWVIDMGPCYGDSGSPALDSDGRAVGVMSRGAGAVCASMVYSRVDAHADWLRGAARAAARVASIDVPAWAADSDAGARDASVDDVPVGDASVADVTDARGADGGPMSGGSGGCSAVDARGTRGAWWTLTLFALGFARRRRARDVKPRP